MLLDVLLRRPTQWQEDYVSDTEFAAYIEDDVLIIWFEGSSIKFGFRSLIDWIQNLFYFAVDTDIGKVHRGLWRKYSNVRFWIWLAYSQQVVKRVEIRGYSQGGGLAQLCYYDLVKRFGEKIPIDCVVAGSPKVVQFEQLAAIDHYVKRGDIVPCLPLFGKWRHNGDIIYFGDDAKLCTPFKHWWTNYVGVDSEDV